MKNSLILLLLTLSFPIYSVQTYEIEKAINEELYIIGGEAFRAKTYCYHMKEGDEVVFLDGSPNGGCLDAKLLNLDSKDLCEVWCE